MTEIGNRPRAATMDKIAALCKRRGFVFPGSEIYGGLANTWDYGPLGAELKNNIKQLWWRTFVHRRRDMVGLDGGILMHPRIWEAPATSSTSTTRWSTARPARAGSGPTT